MRNLIVLSVLLSFLAVAIVVGHGKNLSKTKTVNTAKPVESIPHIGSIQVLNGCGIEKAAEKMADYLRKEGFDVKNHKNATGRNCWNYPFTIVVSKSTNMNNAERVANALKTDKIIQIRENDSEYDVVVFVGPDFGELIH